MDRGLEKKNKQVKSNEDTLEKTQCFENIDLHISMQVDDKKMSLGSENSHLHNINNLIETMDRGLQKKNRQVKINEDTLEKTQCFENIDSHISIQVDDKEMSLGSENSNLHNINNLNEKMDTGLQKMNKVVKIKEERLENKYCVETIDSHINMQVDDKEMCLGSNNYQSSHLINIDTFNETMDRGLQKMDKQVKSIGKEDMLEKTQCFETIDSHIKMQVDDKEICLANENSHLRNINNLNEKMGTGLQKMNELVKSKEDMLENKYCVETIDSHITMQVGDKEICLGSKNSHLNNIDNVNETMDMMDRGLQKKNKQVKSNVTQCFENIDSHTNMQVDDEKMCLGSEPVNSHLPNTNNHNEVMDRGLQKMNEQVKSKEDTLEKTQCFENIDSHIGMQLDDKEMSLESENSHLHNINNLNETMVSGLQKINEKVRNKEDALENTQDRKLQNVNKGVKVTKEKFQNDNSCCQTVDIACRVDTIGTVSKFPWLQDILNRHKIMDTELLDVKQEVKVYTVKDNLYIFKNINSDCANDDAVREKINTKPVTKNPEEQKQQFQNNPENVKTASHFGDTNFIPEQSDSTIKSKNNDLDFESSDNNAEKRDLNGLPKNVFLVFNHVNKDSGNTSGSTCNLNSEVNSTCHCYICKKDFKTLPELKQHMLVHTSDPGRPHQCDVCGERFKTLVSSRQHMTLHSTEQLHQCNMCGKEFKTMEGLKQHMISHKTERPFLCSVCGKGFKSMHYLTVHMISHSTERPNKCLICEKVFKTCSALRRHTLSHSSERPHQCNVCDKGFKTTKALKRHKLTHATERKHKCSNCDKGFKTLDELRRHMISHETEEPHLCDFSGKGFKTTVDLREHMILHSTERPHLCNVCGKGFKTMVYLKKHLFTHNTERPHLCDLCGKGFKRVGYLKSHMLFHKTERPHKCSICEKEFRTLICVRQHMLSHSTERPHQCNICEKRFKTINNLRHHMISHSTERPHQCNMCEKGFKTINDLKCHMRSHSTERPHQCNMCKKGFKTINDLRHHMVSHSTERPHQCYICEKRFKTINDLRHHMVSHSTERAHQCNICEKGFKTIYALRRHMILSHSTGQRHQCNRCDKTFKNRKTLQHHRTNVCKIY